MCSWVFAPVTTRGNIAKPGFWTSEGAGEGSLWWCPTGSGMSSMICSGVCGSDSSSGEGVGSMIDGGGVDHCCI